MMWKCIEALSFGVLALLTIVGVVFAGQMIRDFIRKQNVRVQETQQKDSRDHWRRHCESCKYRAGKCATVASGCGCAEWESLYGC
jgi:hypothetical protein